MIRNYSWLGKLQYFRWWPNETAYSSNCEEDDHQRRHNFLIHSWQFPTYWQRVWRQGRLL